ncbi:AAA family ATPase [Xylanimonas protaetiae]|uniref:ATP-binding protein n=1 Tax=Xylanimonas protaetiae TaxID=2509457 RepID=A0A4P6F0G7_9MICO|nr:AAA family ATPase [Xylanimonas protaetiae]QAY68952.1 ATP-binding protein [Xylanimonas protaetiae]
MIRTLAVDGYRSVRSLVLALDRLTVVTGANGVGKSSLYRSLRLLAECAAGGVVGAVAREGGLASTLWAGPEVIGRAVREGRHPVQGTVRSGPVSLRLGFASDDLGYAVDLGLPQQQKLPDGSRHPFANDPEIKVEAVWTGPVPRPAALAAERRGPAVRVRGDDGAWQPRPGRLRTFESMLTEVVDPARAPELLDVRERLRGWRFYDQLRTDLDAPARTPQVGTRTPVLGPDGADLAAALATIADLGLGSDLERAVSRAFPGSRLAVDARDGRFEVRLHQHGLLRPLTAAELSDGTLRYLLWVAALLTPRPPELLVLNEPETSLHPDLLPALGELVREAAQRTQVVVVTHSAPLVAAMGSGDGVARVELVKDFGETRVAGREGRFDQPPWTWPSR